MLELTLIGGGGPGRREKNWGYSTASLDRKPTMSIDTFRAASKSDAEAIAQLVNKAYRPETGPAGWTHESNLVSGNRTSAGQVAEVMSKPDSVILVGLKGSDIVACVHVEKDGRNSHIGMLAVNPKLQGAGAGKQMLAHAERYANESFGSEKFIMAVVSSRSELIAFYLRRGYQKTGAVQDYPLSAGVGTPKFSDLKTEALEKRSLQFIQQGRAKARPLIQTLGAMKILAISGSLRAVSLNTALLRAVARLAPADISVVLYRGLGDLPLFNPDIEASDPPPVAELRTQILSADALLIASPEYAHGVTGVMKNALDWMVGCEAFVHKPVALLNASPRAVHAQAALRETVTMMSACIVDEASITVPILGSNFSEDEIVLHPDISASLMAALFALRAAVVAARTEVTATLPIGA